MRNICSSISFSVKRRHHFTLNDNVCRSCCVRHCGSSLIQDGKILSCNLVNSSILYLSAFCRSVVRVGRLINNICYVSCIVKCQRRNILIAVQEGRALCNLSAFASLDEYRIETDTVEVQLTFSAAVELITVVGQQWIWEGVFTLSCCGRCIGLNNIRIVEVDKRIALTNLPTCINTKESVCCRGELKEGTSGSNSVFIQYNRSLIVSNALLTIIF